MTDESAIRPEARGVRSRMSTLALLGSINFWSWVAVAIGVTLRITEYCLWRPAYMDEEALLSNLVEMSVFDFHTILLKDQMAAPGFLVLARLWVRLPGNDILVCRLIPLVSGIISVFLMRTVAWRYLSPRAVPLAVALFGLVEWMIYYATELKQYSSDALLTLITLWVAIEPPITSADMIPTWRTRRYVAVLLIGVVGVWFSQPLIFLLPGVGLYLVHSAVAAKDARRVKILVAIGAAWLVSFAASYAIAKRIMSKRDFLWDWWNFAFLPIPPHSVEQFKQELLQLVNVLISPCGIELPEFMIASAYLAVTLFMVGCWSLGRRSLASLGCLLLLPIILAVAASALRLYPFHGRLLLFLVPIFHLIIAQGAIAITRRCGLVATIALSLLLLAEPVRDVTWAQFMSTRNRGQFDTHGDLAPDLLDYLDRLEREAKNPMPFR
jgi:hypothetical protein